MSFIAAEYAINSMILAGYPVDVSYDGELNMYGGNSGMFHFITEGEHYRAPNDEADNARSKATFDFVFDDGQVSPLNTVISLFDPGSLDGEENDNSVYRLQAYLNGAPVDTSLWEYQALFPFEGGTQSESIFVWDAASGTFTVNDFGLEGPYPDVVVLFHTNGSVFDRFVLTSDSHALDIFAVGIGVIPEPSRGLFMAMCLGGWLLRRRR